MKPDHIIASDKSTWKPVTQSSFLLPAGSNAATSLGFLMVVSRMLTRHQHEPRARLRSATSGTMKRKGAAARAVRQTGQHRFRNARFTAGFAVWQAFPKGLHPTLVFRFNLLPSVLLPPFLCFPFSLASLIRRVFSQRVGTACQPSRCYSSDVRALRYVVLEKVGPKLWTDPFLARGDPNRAMTSISAASCSHRGQISRRSRCFYR